MSDSKNVSIVGTNNRYQIRKLIQEKEICQRKIFKKIDMLKYSHEEQKNILSKLNYEVSNNHDTSNEDCVLFIKEIKNKLSSYKQQDFLKKIFDDMQFISLENTIELLQSSNLECHYCSQQIHILYEIVREQMQWTLDRIDNDKGHNKNNVVISCLKCNLNRRRTSKDAFMFTKNLNIIKTDSS